MTGIIFTFTFTIMLPSFLSCYNPIIYILFTPEILKFLPVLKKCRGRSGYFNRLGFRSAKNRTASVNGGGPGFEISGVKLKTEKISETSDQITAKL